MQFEAAKTVALAGTMDLPGGDLLAQVNLLARERSTFQVHRESFPSSSCSFSLIASFVLMRITIFLILSIRLNPWKIFIQARCSVIVF